MKNRKIQSVIEKTNYDRETGEVTHSEAVKVLSVPNEPAFIKLYLDDIVKLHDMQKAHSTVMFKLLELLEYSTNEIVINMSRKRQIPNISTSISVFSAVMTLTKNFKKFSMR